MYTIFITLAIVYGLDGIQAFWFNMKTDAQQQEQGQVPMPVSAYIMLAVRYIARVIFALLAAFYLPIIVNPWLTFVVVYVIILYLTRLLETIVRFAVVTFYKNKLKDQGVEENQNEGD